MKNIKIFLKGKTFFEFNYTITPYAIPNCEKFETQNIIIPNVCKVKFDKDNDSYFIEVVLDDNSNEFYNRLKKVSDIIGNTLPCIYFHFGLFCTIAFNVDKYCICTNESNGKQILRIDLLLNVFEDKLAHEYYETYKNNKNEIRPYRYNCLSIKEDALNFDYDGFFNSDGNERRFK